MNTTHAPHTPPTVAADEDRLLGVSDLMARYGIGRTKAYGLLDSPGFPSTVVANLTRIPLRAIRLHEVASSLATTIVDPATAGDVIAAAAPGDVDRLIDLEGIEARYGVARSKASDIVRRPGFPASVVPNTTRIPLLALRAHELAVALVGTAADTSAATSPSTIETVSPVASVPAALLIGPPASRRPGRVKKAVA